MLSATHRRAPLNSQKSGSWYDSCWLSYKINYSGRWSKIIQVVIVANDERIIICHLLWSNSAVGLTSIAGNHRIRKSRVWSSGTCWRLCRSLVELMSATRHIHGQVWRSMGFCHFVVPEHLATHVRPLLCQVLQQGNQVHVCSSRAYKISFYKGTMGCFHRLENTEESVVLSSLPLLWLI